MTKNDVQRLKGLLISATGNIASLKGQAKSPDRMNVEEMRCLVTHWHNTGKEILEILASEELQQPDLFEDDKPVILNLDEDGLTVGRVTVEPAKVATNGAGEEVDNK
jgi:hypothetical protein